MGLEELLLPPVAYYTQKERSSIVKVQAKALITFPISRCSLAFLQIIFKQVNAYSLCAVIVIVCIDNNTGPILFNIVVVVVPLLGGFFFRRGLCLLPRNSQRFRQGRRLIFAGEAFYSVHMGKNPKLLTPVFGPPFLIVVSLS